MGDRKSLSWRQLESLPRWTFHRIALVGRLDGWMEVPKQKLEKPCVTSLSSVSLSPIWHAANSTAWFFLESKVICFHRIGGGTFTATEFVEKKCLSHILNKPKLFQLKASFKPWEFICVLVNIGEWQFYSQQETSKREKFRSQIWMNFRKKKR